MSLIFITKVTLNDVYNVKVHGLKIAALQDGYDERMPPIFDEPLPIELFNNIELKLVEIVWVAVVYFCYCLLHD